MRLRSGRADYWSSEDGISCHSSNVTPKLAIHLHLPQILCQRVRHANEICATIAFLDLPTRLARLLVQLDRTYGEQLGTSRRIGLKLSQEELGHLIAMSRESVNKQLQAWQADGLVELARGYIVIRDINSLCAIGALSLSSPSRS